MDQKRQEYKEVKSIYEDGEIYDNRSKAKRITKQSLNQLYSKAEQKKNEVDRIKTQTCKEHINSQFQTAKQRKEYYYKTGFTVVSPVKSSGKYRPIDQDSESNCIKVQVKPTQRPPEEVIGFKQKNVQNIFYASETKNLAKNFSCSLQTYIKLNMFELIEMDQDLSEFMKLGGRDKGKQKYLGEKKLQYFFKTNIGRQIANQFIGDYQFSLPMIQGQKADIEQYFRYISKYACL